MTIAKYLFAQAPAITAILSAWFIALLAQRLSRWMVKRIRAELAAFEPHVPLLALPVQTMTHWFTVWLVINAGWLALITRIDAGYLAGSIVLLAVLGVLAMVDAQTGILPNELILLSMIIVLACVWQVSSTWLPAQTFLWGMTLGYGIPTLFNAAYRLIYDTDALGQGDAKLLAVLGLWLGIYALADVWLIACALLLVYTAVKRCQCKNEFGLKSSMPFGPFLVLAANVVFIYGLA